MMGEIREKGGDLWINSRRTPLPSLCTTSHASRKYGMHRPPLPRFPCLINLELGTIPCALEITVNLVRAFILSTLFYSSISCYPHVKPLLIPPSIIQKNHSPSK